MAHTDRVRLSIDIPIQQHIHLKMLASKKGMSMRAYILESLAYRERLEDEKIDTEMDETTFRKGLERLRKERSRLAKKLSKR